MTEYGNISQVLCAAFLFLFIIYIVYNSHWFQIYKVALLLPGPPALPIIGNALLATDNEELYNLGNTMYQRYGRLSRIWISVLPVFIIFEPKDVQNVLGTYKNTEKNYFYSLMHNFLGEGLITSNGEKWRIHRKLIQPFFHMNILSKFVETFSQGSLLLTGELNYIIDKQADINVTEFINNSVLNILHETVLGIPMRSKDRIHQISPFRKGKVVAQNRIEKPWLLFNCIYNLTNNSKDEHNQKENLYSFSKKMIQLRRRKFSSDHDETSKPCLMDMMIELVKKYPEFTDDEIISEISTFMLAGQDSVSSSIVFCLYYLAKNPLIQEKVYDEQCAIFSNGVITLNIQNLKQMKYLEQCIKETMRICPSVPLMARQLGENITIGNYVLPAGSNILISPFISHRLSHIYPNPQEFDPSRFSSQETEKRHAFAYLPFSAGPRNCIGHKFAMLEMKCIISKMIRDYHMAISPGYELNLTFRITLRAKGGVWLRMKPRKNKNLYK